MSRVLLAIGDPNGIGPEIAVAAATRAVDPPVLVGDHHVLADLAAARGFRLREHRPGAPAEPGVLDLVDVGHLPPDEFRPGVLSAEAGSATIAYVSRAVTLALGGGYRGVVACPHSETAVHAAGIAFRGYPPLIAQLTGVPEDRVFLLLSGGGLNIVHTTLHERLADALARLTPELVTAAGLALGEALRTFGIDTPRLGVFGINPHAGEGGLFGSDDERVTAPAVAALASHGLDVTGPTGADVLLTTPGHHGFVAHYHDQGHIPIKLLAGRTATALTVGAGVPFCSVGHGTAFDIAGRGVADPTAVERALGRFGRTKETTA
ncbi:4-hydroxythreonine-4-phosphate dehydrogenase PdxA [Amycolatopsis rhabdoformis]|uniref:4-hydroxythreonine-4-phosphate dehydrogenase PdxA n=1 Tax=Amycolatopsis rhabdoformis TaxID=1448059 RepID=A0ABZ1HX51_9PSEU|nr:4-hydroxythreonine-4-phosphate dehydrogenase PdxA [Amycolatopsis rhabdoformis]WSE25954.1 4-hydroxythreonine-4-phosphate dehydrogenase PdxA [Amycolatopsis rhabdoformis]